MQNGGIQQFSVQLYDRSNDQKTNTTFLPPDLLAAGKLALDQKKAKEKPNNFSISDILVGYDLTDEPNDDPIPFTISLENTIPEQHNLFVYFQLLNMALSTEGRTEIELELWVEKDRGLLGIFTNETRNTVQFSVQEFSSKISESYEIDLANQEAGKYILKMLIKDLASNEEIKAEVKFEIISTQ
jgi:hypothetical protein